jgi:hypothetical protein
MGEIYEIYSEENNCFESDLCGSNRHLSILRVFKESNLDWNTKLRLASHEFYSRHIVQNF